MKIEILVDWESLGLKKPKSEKEEKPIPIDSFGRILNDNGFRGVDAALFQSKIFNGAVWLEQQTNAKRYIYDDEGNKITGKTKGLSIRTFPNNEWFWDYYWLNLRENAPLPLSNLERDGLNFYSMIEESKVKPIGTMEGFRYKYEELNSYYQTPQLNLINSKINGLFGIDFFDSKYRFCSFSTNDKKNYKLTLYPYYSSQEVEFKFKNNKTQKIFLIPRYYETNAFWYDNYLYATWFTTFVKPLGRYAHIRDFIPFHPIPFGREQSAFNFDILNYIPPQLKDDFENTNAPSDYAIEHDLYNKALISFNPHDFEVFNLFFMILYIGSSQVSYLSRVLPNKIGDLVGIILVKDKPIFIWRKIDETLPDDLDYLAAGSMWVDFNSMNNPYYTSYPKLNKYDV